MGNKKEAGAIILSGGKNTRMKANKAFLEVGQQKLIETITNVLQESCAQVIIVTNEPQLYQYLGVKVTIDVIPGLGPLSGMHAGLLVSPYHYNFIVACDMPFVEADLVRYLLDGADGYDLVVPRVGGHLQPLHAVYAKSCIPYIEECLHRRIFKIIDFYHQVRVKYVEEDKISQLVDLSKVFYNVNTPQELAHARKMAGDKTKEAKG